ncbi:ABC transporter [Streptomyces pluripotens]|uniref:ABC transporter n=1 Tax=Streptomyces pluripotens TaxID=1355015 RepID=A0A221P3N8_9ACTN|nr:MULTISPECIES: ABC transporter substrate-binding protein [Streptomyces]ARP72138.1 ABC transporter [Streptomyces pluripotens]ASN26385.1 ABC transporter [Streptomyces pluripotens]KIE22998.1 ABC transporter [Streptomyces sp. MUSC 125]MCH0555996.1 ABC transporter substrate-binding protein [Streptomyces sp. MUM 16J]
MSRGRRHAYGAFSVLAAGALALAGCSKGGSDSGGNDNKDQQSAKRQQAPIKFGDAADSTGPAPAVPGAKTGGTMEVLQRDSYAHLDPGQIYVSDEMSVAQLIHRGLTGYKATSNDGKEHEVVGDLATDSGTTTDGGKTWKYTLKDGIKFQDGSPITSKDIRHSIERLFAPFINQGPTYLQQWLADTSGADYRKLLKDGPYKGKHLPDSILATPDDKTVIFHFQHAHPDLPYALAMSGYAVVSAKGDTKQQYDKAPEATGPYKIQSFKSGKSMVLVKNPNWDPKTDPIRHQYVDRFNFTFNQQFETSTKALLADTGADRTGVSFNNQVDAGNLSQVLRDPKLKSRRVSGYQPYVGQMNINLSHPAMQDKTVREAIAYALPITPFLRAYGGTDAMEVAGGLISPTVSGYDPSFDPWGKKKKPAGDPQKARELLKKAGKLNMKLTFGYVNTPEGQQYSTAMAAGLKKAGFDVQRQEIPAENYYDQVSKLNNNYDIFHTAWGADWPSASTVIPPLYDGRVIANGAQNYSQVNDPKVNSEIDRINQITDPVKSAAEWEKLDQYLVKDVINVVPTAYYKQTQIAGSKVGGLVYDDVIGGIDPRRLYIK